MSDSSRLQVEAGIFIQGPYWTHILQCEVFTWKHANKLKYEWKGITTGISFLEGQRKGQHWNHETMNRKEKSHFSKHRCYLPPNTQKLTWTQFTTGAAEESPQSAFTNTAASSHVPSPSLLPKISFLKLTFSFPLHMPVLLQATSTKTIHQSYTVFLFQRFF